MTPDQFDALKALQAVRTLLGVEDRWTKGFFARRDDRTKCGPRQPEARCWCLTGALMKVLPESELQRLTGLLSHSLNQVIPPLAAEQPYPGGARRIAAFNDALSTAHKDVLGVLDKAIAKLEAA